MRRFVIFGILMLASVCVFGQGLFTVFDTVHIGEVVSYGSLQKYQSGAKIEQISTRQFEQSKDGNLEQLLSRTLPIAFKADAGGLATIRIRGSAPDHTSINFGGININSLTLGQTNVSNVPLYLFDNVSVQFGSASSVNGSGSIGGAIHLGIQNKWTDGFRGEARVSHGSFGEQLYGTKLFFGNGKFESGTRFYYYAKKNNFPFMNPNYRDFENQIFEIKDRQQNANVENYGLLQELNYRFNRDEYFTFNIWLEKDWHLIQQNMQTNLSSPEMREDLTDDHIRALAAYKNRKKPFKFEISGGYVYDNSVNNHNTADTIQTQRIIGEAFAEHDFRKNASYKVGAKATRIYPTVYAYSASLDHEDRIDFYASYYQRFFQKLTATVNLRQGFVTGFDVPFTPALGLSYLAFSKEKYVLSISGNISRSYRVPTFNDRFWVPGGDPDLKPEKGMSYELGAKWSYCTAGVSGNIQVNAFWMDVDNWLLWKNGGAFWYAENVQKVESKGIELMTDWHYQILGLSFESGLNYSYNPAERVESINETNALNRQLEYVPLHSGNIYTTANLHSFDFTIDGRYSDSMYTDEEVKNVLDPYFLLNATVGYKLKINDQNKLRISGMVRNLLDTAYQTSWGYAMPGINYRISVTYNFK
ncbi:TonB-dependent receptor [Maribellus sp. YY47]|uniref:TonB-dependent receptor n=1 Tax=Maribellus sp. YY47 TaxID=2929486 RepID=UPI002000EEF5|nr:TonB-dependent receptor [Maribellus sp. YY47]MCK3685231.1 TonB-dependent receptor [Maribellus sp. YY47]